MTAGGSAEVRIRPVTKTSVRPSAKPSGMSHWPASIGAYAPAVTPQWRNFLIHGNPFVDEVEAGRIAKAPALADGGATGEVADDWDTALLARLTSEPRALRTLDAQDVATLAGLRTWAAASAAWGGEPAWTAYEAVPQWINGMGIVASAAPAMTEV